MIVDSSEHEAHHQVDVRGLNELSSHAALHPGSRDADTLCLRCECGDRYCDATLTATRDEYDTVRAMGTRFLIRDTHENPEISVVVDANRRFATVDTVGRDARRIVLRTNPRLGWPSSPDTSAEASRR